MLRATHWRAPQAPREVTVAFRGTDGVDGEGPFAPAGQPGRAPLVVLVHEYRGGPEQWRPLVALLHRAGLASFRFGLRKIGELDEPVDARDVRGALRMLSIGTLHGGRARLKLAAPSISRSG
jgi:alpha-beta hydrolase superfamily lysophospholipase